MKQLWVRAFAIITAIVVVGYVAARMVVPQHLKETIPQIEQIATEYINGSVSIEDLKWNGGLGIVAKNVNIENIHKEKVLFAPEAFVRVNLLEGVFNFEKIIDEVVIKNPVVYLDQNAKGEWNLSDIIKPSDSDEIPFYGKVLIEKGVLDLGVPDAEWELKVTGTIDAKNNPNFNTNILVENGPDQLSVKGMVTEKLVGELNFFSDSLRVGNYSYWIKKYGKISDSDGEIHKLDLKWVNDGKEINISGVGKLKEVKGVYNDGTNDWEVMGDGNLDFEKREVFLTDFKLAVNKQEIDVSGHINYADLENLQGKVDVKAKKFTYDEYEIENILVKANIDNSRMKIFDSEFGYGGGNIKFKGDYDFNSGDLAAILEIKDVNTKIPGNSSDLAMLKGEFGLSGVASQEHGIDVNLVANTAQVTIQDLVFNVANFDVSLKDKDAKINNLSVRTNEGALIATGFIDYDGQFEIVGRTTKMPLKPILERYSQNASGYVSSDFKAYGTPDDINFNGVFLLDQIELAGFKIKDAHGMMNIKDNVISLNNYVVEMDQGKHMISGTIDVDGDEPIVDLDVTTKNVRIEPFAALAGEDVKLTGNLDNRVSLKGTLSNLTAVGNVNMFDGSAYGYLVDEIKGEYSFNDGAITLKDFIIQALSTTVTLDGVMDKARNLNFQMNAHNIDLEKLPIREEDVDLSGDMSAQGKLTGSLSEPFFEGSINSEQFYINGQEITSFLGVLKANGRDYNELKGFCTQNSQIENKDAMYDIDVVYNGMAGDLKGKIKVENGNLGSLLKITKQEYVIDGVVNGDLVVDSKSSSGVAIDAEITNVKIHDIPYYKMDFKGHLANKILYFDNVKLQENEKFTEKGIIAVGGNVDFKKEEYNVEIGAIETNPGIITAIMAHPIEIKGNLNIGLQFMGTFSNPIGNGSIELKEGSIYGIYFEELTGMVNLKDDNLRIEQLLVKNGEYALGATGDIPIDLFRDKPHRRNPNAQMDINFDVSKASLGILPIASRMIEWGVGDTEGNVNIKGTLEEPLVHGELKIENGSIKITDINTPLDQLSVDVVFNGNHVDLKSFSTNLGKGNVTATGTYAWRAAEEDSYKIDIIANNADIVSEIFTGRINGELKVQPKKYVIRNRNDENVGRETFRPSVEAKVRFDDVLVNMPTVPSVGEGESNIGLDVKVEFGPKVRLYNKYLYDLWLTGNVNIQGSTVFPMIDGTVTATRGTVTYLRTPFKLSHANVSWPLAGSFFPAVSLEGKAKFSRYNITMNLSGTIDALDLQLTSNPPLKREEIVRMLTLQRVSAGSGEVTNQDIQGLLATGLEMALLGDVEEFLKKALHIDQFRIYSGKINTGVEFDSYRTRELTNEEKNQYNILISKNITPHWMLGYTTSFNNEHHSFFTQLNIANNWSLTMSLDEKQVKKYYLEYSVTFN